MMHSRALSYIVWLWPFLLSASLQAQSFEALIDRAEEQYDQEASVEQGESDERHFAMMQDRVLANKGELQIYGTQVITDKKTGASTLVPIKEPHLVDGGRKAIGLGPLKEYLKRYGIEWNLAQKTKEDE